MQRLILLLLITAAATLASAGTAAASHIPGQPCNGCASHAQWPRIDGKHKKAGRRSVRYTGTERHDELLGHHGSDILRGLGRSDVLWGDWDGTGQPTCQRDRIYGGSGNDFIYGSLGRNVVYGGAGNDAISVHYGRGVVDCGPGREIYHVARTRRKGYTFRNGEKVDHRREKQRGGGLEPLP